MAIPSGIVQKRTCVRIRTLGPVIFLGAQAVILAPSRTRPTEQTKQASNDSARRAEAPAEKAWRILHEGLEDANSERRARAVHALGCSREARGLKRPRFKDCKTKNRMCGWQQPRRSARCTRSVRRAISKKRWGIRNRAWCWPRRIRCCCFTTNGETSEM